MQLLQLSVYKVLILFFAHILRQVLVQNFKQIQEETGPSGINKLPGRHLISVHFLSHSLALQDIEKMAQFRKD